MSLDAADIDTLFDALEAWVYKDGQKEIMELVVIGATIHDEAKSKEMASERAVVYAADRRIRKERAVLLQATLINMKDKLVTVGEV